MSNITDIKWRTGSRFKVDPSKAHECIETIRTRNGGCISADDVVKEAKKKRSPIHEEFNWDDASAAHEHRKDRARAMLRSIVVVRVEAPDVLTRQYEVRVVSDNEEDSADHERVYYRTEDLLADPEQRERLLARAVSALRAMREKYRQLSELAVVFQAIDQLSAAA